MTDHQQFIVIRHGESQTNATDTFQASNQTDLDPLTPLGMEDARRLAERLAELPVDVIVSSSYLRARSTAGAIADVTGAPHVVPVWNGSSWVDLPAKDPELREHVSLFREIDVPSELRGLRFDDPRARQIQHGQDVPDRLVNRERVRVVLESLEEQLEGLVRAILRVEVPRQRQSGPPLAR